MRYSIVIQNGHRNYSSYLPDMPAFCLNAVLQAVDYIEKTGESVWKEAQAEAHGREGEEGMIPSETGRDLRPDNYIVDDDDMPL